MIYDKSFERFAQLDPAQPKKVVGIAWEGRGYGPDSFEADMQFAQSVFGSGPVYSWMADGYILGAVLTSDPNIAPDEPVECIQTRHGQQDTSTMTIEEILGATDVTPDQWTQHANLQAFLVFMDGLDPDGYYSQVKLAQMDPPLHQAPTELRDGDGVVVTDGTLYILFHVTHGELWRGESDDPDSFDPNDSEPVDPVAADDEFYGCSLVKSWPGAF
jgi:hypothetical protein